MEKIKSNCINMLSTSLTQKCFTDNRMKVAYYIVVIVVCLLLLLLLLLVHVYKAPRPDEIQDILTQHEVSLNQLREKAEIKYAIKDIRMNQNYYMR